MSQSLKRRPSFLYHADTYAGGYLLHASSIESARRKVMRTSVRYVGHVVKRATRADVQWGYPMLRP